MTRVLLVTLNTYSSPHNRGKLAHLARRVKSLDVITGDIPTLWSAGGSPQSLTDDFRIHLLKPQLRLSRGTTTLAGLSRIANTVKPSVIHIEAEPFQLVSVQAVRAARKLGVPVGIQLNRHGPGMRGLKGRLRKLLARRILAQCTYAIGWTSRSTAIAATLAPGLPLDTMPATGVTAVKPNGTDVASDRSTWFGNQCPDAARIAFAGRLVPEKGVRDFLLASDAIARSMPVQVALAGTGPLEFEVRQWVRERSWAHFHGLLPRAQVRNLFSCADAVVMPSLTIPTWDEQFGKAAIEAMSVGAPVIAYDCGALAEVIGDGGRVVPEGRVDALVGALEDFLTLQRPERAAARDRAREQARLFTDEVLAERLCSLWKSLGITSFEGKDD